MDKDVAAQPLQVQVGCGHVEHAAHVFTLARLDAPVVRNNVLGDRTEHHDASAFDQVQCRAGLGDNAADVQSGIGDQFVDAHITSGQYRDALVGGHTILYNDECTIARC